MLHEENKLTAQPSPTIPECPEEDGSAEDSCEQAAGFVQGALLLQEKWVMMIVFSLLQGPAGFSALMRRGSINTTTLTQRLNLLEHMGLLVKTIHSTMPPRTSYELTEAGLALKPILDAIAQWSGTYLPGLPAVSECAGEDAA